jgi:hypothetical protein
VAAVAEEVGAEVEVVEREEMELMALLAQAE